MATQNLPADSKSLNHSRATSMVSVTQTLTEPEQVAIGALTPKEKETAPLESYSEKKAVSPVIEADNTSVKPDVETNTTDTPNYPTGVALGLIVLALCLAVFLVALDQTIIATAIPKITDEFNSLADVGWYGSAYMLTTCGLQLIAGRLYAQYSLKWIFLGAIGLFEVGSLVCGVAPSSVALIIGRAIQGVGASGIFSGALTILAHSVPLEKRPMYTGSIGGMFGIASVAGPLLGGVFSDEVSWRWCFYINLPIGAITIVVIAVFFKPPHRTKASGLTTKEKLRRFDFIGTGLLLPAIVCLLLALQWGGSKYEWSAGRIIALFVVFGVLIIGFIYQQFRAGENATLPIRIIKMRSVAAACLVAFSLGSAFMLLIFYVPLWFQAIGGTTATQSGIRNLPFVLGVTIFSVFSGIGVTIIGYYAPFMIIGGAIFSIGAGLITTFEVDTGAAKWISYQIIAGIGVGLVIQQPMIAVQTILNLEDVSTGLAAVVFSQTLGGALFIAVGQSVFNNQLVKGLSDAAIPGLEDPSALLMMGATSLRGAFEERFIPVIIAAYNEALVHSYRVAVALAVLATLFSLGMEWISVKGKKIEMGGGA